MAKLSRIKKNQELRDRLEEETTAAQSQPEQPIKLTRMSRSQNKEQQPAEIKKPAVLESVEASRTTAVMDELLGEVKQYNIENGDRVIEDTQINILRTLDEDADPSMKRSRHLETMEANKEFDGGTTMNINARNIEEVAKVSARPVTQPEERKVPVVSQETLQKNAAKAAGEDVVVLGKMDLWAEDPVGSDNLDVYDLNADDFDKTIRQESIPAAKPVSRKEAKEAKKSEKKAQKKSLMKAEEISDSYLEQTDEYEDLAPSKPKKVSEKSGKVGNIVLVILILILLGFIGYTIYLILQSGIL